MAFAFFCSETYLKDNTPLTLNIDPQDLYPFMKETQDIYAQNVLGSKLYNRLIDGIINNNLTADETDLLLKVRQMLVWYVVYEAMPFIGIKLRNKGIMKTAGDNQTNADLKETQYLRNESKNKAEYYRKRVQDYLCDNGTLFSEYTDPDCPISPDKKAGYRIDLYLGNCSLDKKFINKYFL